MVNAAPGLAVESAVGVDAGYAFRSQTDGRNHGAAAFAFSDVPLPGPLALRPELLALAFGPAGPKPALALLGGALSLVYAFDDTDVQALIAVGPLAAAAVEGNAASLRAGALVALGLRVPVVEGATAEARVSVPLVLYGAQGIQAPGQQAFADGTAVDFPFQVSFTFGVAFDVGSWLKTASKPRSPGRRRRRRFGRGQRRARSRRGTGDPRGAR